MTEPAVLARPPKLVVRRVLKAPREIVFKAWSHADHVKRWFAPVGCSISDAEVDFRSGGAFNLTMLIPGGAKHGIRAAFTSVDPFERIGFAGVVDTDGKPGFRIDTEVLFTPVAGGTELVVTQAYEIYDEAFLRAVEGASQGWRSTLDNLAREAARLKDAPPRSAVHGEFTIRRAFATTPDRLYGAFTDVEAKAKWFVGPPGWTEVERHMDARYGGRERAKGQFPNGTTTCFDAVYLDIIPGERLVYAYEMRLDDAKISVSLATLTFAPDPKGALLTLTEQGVFLDGYDDSGNRERGTMGLLDQVERSLAG